jgi:AraC-like DNA-binding protein
MPFSKYTSIPVLSMRSIEPALQDLRRRGVDIGDCCEEAGLSPEVMENLDLLLPAYIVNKIAAICAARSGNPTYFSDLGAKLHCEEWQPSRAGPDRNLTLGGFLMTVSAGSLELGNALSLSLVIEDRKALIADQGTGRTAWSTEHLDAFVVSFLLSRFRRSLGEPLDPACLMIRVGDPKLLIPEFRALGVMSGNSFSIRFPAEWLGLALEPRPDVREDSRETRRQEVDFAQVIRNYLALVAEKSEMTAEDTARMCGVTPRELREELASKGTSLIELIEEAKCDYARKKIATGAKSMTEIGMDLGYASVATFSRSFKRWTGTSPRDFRKRSIVNAPPLTDDVEDQTHKEHLPPCAPT